MTDAAPQVRFTPTQLKIVQLLADGVPHRRQDMIDACLYDSEQGSPRTLSVHIVGARRMLQVLGEDIICELVNRQICYRRVRLLESARANPRPALPSKKQGV